LHQNESLIKQLDKVGNEIDLLFNVSSPITWLANDPKEYLMKYTVTKVSHEVGIRHHALVSCG
jgi:hypothetical protein